MSLPGISIRNVCYDNAGEDIKLNLEVYTLPSAGPEPLPLVLAPKSNDKISDWLQENLYSKIDNPSANRNVLLKDAQEIMTDFFEWLDQQGVLERAQAPGENNGWYIIDQDQDLLYVTNDRTVQPNFFIREFKFVAAEVSQGIYTQKSITKNFSATSWIPYVPLGIKATTFKYTAVDVDVYFKVLSLRGLNEKVGDFGTTATVSSTIKYIYSLYENNQLLGRVRDEIFKLGIFLTNIGIAESSNVISTQAYVKPAFIIKEYVLNFVERDQRQYTRNSLQVSGPDWPIFCLMESDETYVILRPDYNFEDRVNNSNPFGEGNDTYLLNAAGFIPAPTSEKALHILPIKQRVKLCKTRNGKLKLHYKQDKLHRTSFTSATALQSMVVYIWNKAVAYHDAAESFETIKRDITNKFRSFDKFLAIQDTLVSVTENPELVITVCAKYNLKLNHCIVVFSITQDQKTGRLIFNVSECPLDDNMNDRVSVTHTPMSFLN